MKIIHGYGFLLLFLFSAMISSLKAQVVLFHDDFTDETVWAQKSGSQVLNRTTTAYGDVDYLNISIYPTAVKTFNQINKTGYIDFRQGSTTISDKNSYIKLPALTFVNGGIFSIVYGAGNSGKKLLLQEKIDNKWVSFTPKKEVTTKKSSIWYTEDWAIEGSGTKILRLVMSSSASILVSEIKVTTNQPEIEIDQNFLDFDEQYYSSGVSVQEIGVTGVNLSTNIMVQSTEGFKVSENRLGPFYPALLIPKEGSQLYVQFTPSVEEGLYLGEMTLSSSGAKSIALPLRAFVLIDERPLISSFILNGIVGEIDHDKQEVIIQVSNLNTSIVAIPDIELLEGATLLTAGEIELTEMNPVEISIEAANGMIQHYTIYIRAASNLSETITMQADIYTEKQKILIYTQQEYNYELYNTQGYLQTKGRTQIGLNIIPLKRGVYILKLENNSYKLIVN